MINLKNIIILGLSFVLTVGLNSNDFKYDNSDMQYGYSAKGNTADEFFVLMSKNPIDLKEQELLKESKFLGKLYAT